MEAVDTNPASAPPIKLTVDELNIEILPVIYEIIRGVEKDHHDNTVKLRESQDCSNKVLELQKRLEQTRTQIRQLPGIEFSKEQQLQNLESLKAQLKLKQELLQKYRFLAFEVKRENSNNEELVKRLSESYPIRQAARVAVSIFNRGKNIADEHDLKGKLEPAKLQEMLKKFSQDVKHEMEEIKRRQQK